MVKSFFGGAKNYPAQNFLVSTYSDEIIEQYNDLDGSDTVVLRYIHPHYNNTFHLTNSKYWITAIEEKGSDFTSTASYKKYAYKFADKSGKHHGRYAKGVKSGKIVHVSRWVLLARRAPYTCMKAGKRQFNI